IQVPLGGVGVKEVQSKVEFTEEVGLRHPVHVISWLEVGKFRACAREHLALGLLAPGGEVSEFRFIAVKAEVDRDLRIQLSHFGDETLSQGVNRGGRAFSHGSTSNSWAESGGPRKCYRGWQGGCPMGVETSDQKKFARGHRRGVDPSMLFVKRGCRLFLVSGRWSGRGIE